MRQDFTSFEPGAARMPAQPVTRSVNASYRALRRARQTSAPLAPADEYAGGSREWLDPLLPPEAERLTNATLAQRAEPSAWCAVALAAAGLALAVAGLANVHLLVASGLLVVGALLSVALNRASEPGWAASALVVAGTAAPAAVALLSAPGDPMVGVALGALVAPVLLAGLLLTPRAPLMVGGVGALACALVLLPREFDRAPAGQLLASLLSAQLLAPVGLILLVTLIAWIWATAMERALTLTANNSTSMARYASLDEQQAHLDRGIQSVLATLAQVANGQYDARVESGTRTVLWQLAQPLNALITRLASAVRADQQLRATERAIDQLTAALERSRNGQPPLWPSASGTRADRLTGLLATSAPQRLTAPLAPTASGELGTAPRVAMRAPHASDVHRAMDSHHFLPALPEHRAPAEFARDAFAQSYPMAPHGTNGHAALRPMARRWAENELPPLDRAPLGGAPGATGSHASAPHAPWAGAPSAPSWPLGDEAAPAVPAWLSGALGGPAHEAHQPGEMPAALPEALATPLVHAAASERQSTPELEWSATGPVSAAPSAIPPAQSWTIVPVVPAEVERPEWPDFLITLEAMRRGQDGDGGDG